MTKLGEPLRVYEVEPASEPLIPRELEEDGEDNIQPDRDPGVEKEYAPSRVPVPVIPGVETED